MPSRPDNTICNGRKPVNNFLDFTRVSYKIENSVTCRYTCQVKHSLHKKGLDECNPLNNSKACFENKPHGSHMYTLQCSELVAK